MLFFDPDRFAILAEPVMTRVDLPGKPYSLSGLVREVYFRADDLPYKCVSFGTRDVGAAMGIDPTNCNKYLDDWGWPSPKYQSQNVGRSGSGLINKTQAVRVYSYPEAEVLIREYLAGVVTNPSGIGKVKTPRLTRRVCLEIATIRAEIEDTINYD